MDRHSFERLPIFHTTFFSVQPRHGMPSPIGHVPGTSLKCRVEHACVRHRALTAQLVKAPAFAMALIAVGIGEAAGIEVRPPRAVLVDDALVGEVGPAAVRRVRAAGSWSRIREPRPAGCKDWAGIRARFTMGLPEITASTPTAPVGFGSAEGTPPQEAQEPIAITAAAFEATSFTTCTAGGRPVPCRRRRRAWGLRPPPPARICRHSRSSPG